MSLIVLQIQAKIAIKITELLTAVTEQEITIIMVAMAMATRDLAGLHHHHFLLVAISGRL
ncbi:MAG: hypothetical protein ACFBSE_25745 [Prochloraceae cyanobacterium]